MSLARSFGQSGVARFIASPAGRVLRVVVGLAVIVWAVMMFNGAARTVLVIVGLIPLSAGVFDLCYLSALIGGPIRGSDLRAMGNTTETGTNG
jgi:hypothetical protein